MKKITLSIFVLATILFACDKDKFETKPQIKVLSTNGPVIPLNSSLRVELEFTDKEGDINGTIYVVRERLNSKGRLVSSAAPYKVPETSNETSGIINVILDYNFHLATGFEKIKIPLTNPEKFEPDTLDVKFVLEDKAGNKSDTAKTNIIVIR